MSHQVSGAASHPGRRQRILKNAVAGSLAGLLVLAGVPFAHAQQSPPAGPREPRSIPAEPLPAPARTYDLRRAIETALQNHPFTGNFRELETLMRRGCYAAARDSRTYVCRSDLAI